MMPEISQRSALGLMAAYRAKTLSPVEAVQDALSRIERFEPAVNAFTIVDAEELGGVMTEKLAELFEEDAGLNGGPSRGPRRRT